MTALFLEALAGIAVSLSILMAMAWTGSSAPAILAGSRHHLDVCGGAGRRRQRAAAGCGRAAAGLFGFAAGSEWGVSHYRMRAE